MDLYCAIDLIAGRAVRLVRGDFSERREFGDPFDLARRFAAGGARRLHVVDLDAARTGRPENRSTVLEIASLAAGLGLAMQVGGGVRTTLDAEQLIEGGVGTVVVGTAAQRDPGLLRDLTEKYPGRVAVGIDHRRGGSQVAVSGWDESSPSSLEEALDRLADLDLASVVVTCIERDGTLEGPDLEGFERALGSTAHSVVASGGVRSASDLVSLATLEVRGRRIEGAIVGMALVEGVLGVEEALVACEASG